MSNVLSNLRKKRGFPVVIDDDTFHVRSLTYGELLRIDSLFQSPPASASETPEQFEFRIRQSFRKSAYMVGCALCSSELGGQQLPRNENETAVEWADRIITEFEEVESDKIRLLSEAVGKLSQGNRGKPVSLETMVKN